MKLKTIPNLIKLISESNDEAMILKYENMMICIFLVPILFLASISSFFTRGYLIKENISMVFIDSFILLIFSFIFEFYLKLKINEKNKENIIIATVSILLSFVVIRFYYLIGPVVWTLSVIVIILSILRMNKKMLIAISFVIFFLGAYIWYTNYDFRISTIYYVGQNIGFTILFIIIASLHKIVTSRFETVKNQYRKIYESEKKLSMTLESVGDGVISVDETGLIDFMNPIAEKLTGWELEEAYKQPFENVFRIINEYTRESVISPIDLVHESGKIVELANHTILISKDGTERSIEDTAAPIVDDNGIIVGVVLVFRDFTDKKEKRQEIEYLSYHDQLTGLYNRRFFEEELKRLDVKRNLPIAVVFADINGLKTINDAFGHGEGDKLIQIVAEVIKNECRGDDIITRTGGDEFIILLPGTEEKHVENLVKRIKLKIQEKTIMDIEISVSFGWDSKTKEDQLIWNVLKNAEDFMYQKKILENSSKRNYVIKSILNTLHIKSPRENAHSNRVSVICEAIGKACDLSEDDIRELKIAGELHDIGKIAIDKVILNKPDKLSDDEWEQMKHHPEIGYRLLGTSNEYYNIASYVLSHHERWDGKGYPKGLKGEEINLKERIISLADAYDAMTCDRPYHRALDKIEAVNEIKKNAGSQFDPELSKLFVEKVLKMEW